MKYCPGCKEHKEFAEFNKNRTTKDGYRVYCRPCDNAETRAWQARNPEKMKANQRNRWKKWTKEDKQRRCREKEADYKRKHPAENTNWLCCEIIGIGKRCTFNSCLEKDKEPTDD